MGSGHSARFSLVAILAVLLSAGGIAYMASISYPDELGIVDAQRRQHQEKAEQIGQGVQEAVVAELQATIPVDERRDFGAYFKVSGRGEVLVPSLEPLRSREESTLEGLLPLRGFRSRQRSLERARGLESQACRGAEQCTAGSPRLRAAATLYESIEEYSDTGAEALLGLARVHRMAAQSDLAASRYRELSSRFRGRVNDADLPYVLLADIGLSEVGQTATTTLMVLRNILNAEYNAPNALLEIAAEQALETLESLGLSGNEASEHAALRRRMQRIQGQTALAMQLASRGVELAAGATVAAKSVVAPWNPTETLIFRRTDEGLVYGMVLSESELQARAASEARGLGLHASLFVRVENLQLASEGKGDADRSRRAQVSLGPLWPHLALVLWQEGASRDGMGDIAEARRRHRAITGSLVAVLVLGLLATVRGAARERELARLKSDFVSTVSHELKTPLTSIRMFAEMLQQGVAGDDKERESHYQGIIVKESERLGLLIANLLDYSQIERGSRQYKEERQDALEIANEAAVTFARFREGEGQALQLLTEHNAGDCFMRADRNVLVQCVLNLLSNAAKYGGDGAIELRVQRNSEVGVVAVSVRDHGPGISTAEQEKIFREFYRAPTAVKSAIEGTGLGLALVKRHVEAQGGTVQVESVLGQGSTFTIRLPEAQ
ncbi:MAG: HAMP domain-containing histidine kinase [Myxococcales bacterium]|nr:HAMP domain-containing histidine kinase [Myxococcales bacterium]